MSPYLLPLAFIAVVYFAMIYLNERYGLFADDHFPSTAAKVAAYLWLGVLLFFLTLEVTASARHVTTKSELARMPFWQLFLLHAVLAVFLLGWWLLTKRPPIGKFLNLSGGNKGELVMIGFAVGVGGWAITMVVALLVAGILMASGLLPHKPEISPMVAWMATLPLWKKAMIVLSAMTVEEAFFRGWLQKRIGLIGSTLLFALAHTSLGQPLLLIGVTAISLIIGFTFYRTKSLIPGIIVHGVFDAVQLFVLIPFVFRMSGMGALS